jgi:L-threonylcarbamoyladenylate synthase
VIVDSDAAGIARCVATLRSGGLVGLPTETVYGLGADATNADAVRRIFVVKGRPSTHPLILHVATIQAALELLDESAETILGYARRFWPGPLTLLGRAHPGVSRVATGGRDTVAVRIPAHVSTLRVLEDLGRPVAAPSANRFGRLSPTTATHVDADLGSDVDIILDGGPCEHGLESTILDISTDSPRIVRPGPIPPAVLMVDVDERFDTSGTAPGTLRSHYAPRRPLVLAQDAAAAHTMARPGDDIVDCAGDPAVVARHLYGWLRDLDTTPVGRIIAIAPRGSGLEWAVRDRLLRAAAPVG